MDVLVAVMLSALSCASAWEQPAARGLPPGDRWPRTRAEWKAEEARRASLGGPTFKEMFPQHAGEFDAMIDWMKRIAATYLEDQPTYDVALADQLLAELYVDHGHPALNTTAQDYVVKGLIYDIARWPEEQLATAARQRLVEGLIEYSDLGGGRDSPFFQASLAETLDRLAENEPVAQSVVEALLTDALVWAEEVDCPPIADGVRRVAGKLWGETSWLRAYEIQAGTRALPAKRPERYEKIVAALTALLTDATGEPKQFSQRLRSVTQDALVEFKEAVLNDDITCRLLIVYRCLLARRPMIPERLSDYMTETLLRVASKSDRLKTERHWRLWADAVRELGSERISDRLKRYVRAMVEDKDLPSVRRAAAERLREVALQEAERPALPGKTAP